MNDPYRKVDYYCEKHKHVTKLLLRGKERPKCEKCIRELWDKQTKELSNYIHRNCFSRKFVFDTIEAWANYSDDRAMVKNSLLEKLKNGR